MLFLFLHTNNDLLDYSASLLCSNKSNKVNWPEALQQLPSIWERS